MTKFWFLWTQKTKKPFISRRMINNSKTQESLSNLVVLLDVAPAASHFLLKNPNIKKKLTFICSTLSFQSFQFEVNNFRTN